MNKVVATTHSFAAGSWSAIWTQRRAWYGKPPPGGQPGAVAGAFATPYFCIENTTAIWRWRSRSSKSWCCAVSRPGAGAGVVLPISWFRTCRQCPTSTPGDGGCGWSPARGSIARPISRTPSAIRRRSISARGYGVQGLGHGRRPHRGRHLLGSVVPGGGPRHGAAGAELLLIPPPSARSRGRGADPGITGS